MVNLIQKVTWSRNPIIKKIKRCAGFGSCFKICILAAALFLLVNNSKLGIILCRFSMILQLFSIFVLLFWWKIFLVSKAITFYGEVS